MTRRDRTRIFGSSTKRDKGVFCNLSGNARLVLFTFVLTVCLLLYWLETKPFWVIYEFSLTILQPTVVKYPERYGGDWSPYMDVLPEAEAFNVVPSTDPNLAVRDMVVNILNGKDHFTVGDDIQLDIRLYDSYGDARHFGGDHIRVRMADAQNDAYVSGYVIDHGNGSYTGMLRALWDGRPTIYAELIYTREEITYLYELRRKLATLRTMSAHFTDKTQNETTVCLPFSDGLSPDRGVCDLTPLNDGLPWFCQAPGSPGLTCQHFSWVQREEYKRDDIENAVPNPYWRDQSRHEPEIQTVINGGRNPSLRNIQEKQNCSDYDLKKLWTQRSPVGYFYGNHWTLSHCRPARPPDDVNCVRGKTIFLYGDSTVKQWFRELQSRFNCTNNFIHSDDREPICWNNDVNLAARFTRHSLPGNIVDGNIGSRRLEDLVEFITEGTVPIFLMHVYSHYTYYHHRIYRDRIKRLRSSIETILKKRPDAMFLFKGPHTMASKYLGVSEYYAYVYRLILIEELEGLHDKVVYLDFKDMSIAKQVEDIHPKPQVVTAMVDEMLAYIC